MSEFNIDAFARVLVKRIDMKASPRSLRLFCRIRRRRGAPWRPLSLLWSPLGRQRARRQLGVSGCRR